MKNKHHILHPYVQGEFMSTFYLILAPSEPKKWPCIDFSFSQFDTKLEVSGGCWPTKSCKTAFDRKMNITVFIHMYKASL